MSWPFITSELLPRESTTLECKTKKQTVTNTNGHRGQMKNRQSHTALYAVQNYLSWNTKKKIHSLKQDPKHAQESIFIHEMWVNS